MGRGESDLSHPQGHRVGEELSSAGGLEPRRFVSLRGTVVHNGE